MPSAQLDLPDRVLVTGAAGGIGAAVVARLAACGVAVVASDVADEPAGHAATTWIRADLASAAGRAAIVAAVGEGLGGFVQAAGIIDPADWESVDEAAADRILAVNLKAPFFLLRALLPRLTADAAVVLVGSVSALRGSPLTPFYSASKAALHHVAASMALALAPRGVRVNVVAPGLVDTPLTDGLNRRLAALKGVSEAEVRAERAAPIPLGRAGTAEEVADACLSLLARQSGYTTGATLYPAGGVLAGVV